MGIPVKCETKSKRNESKRNEINRNEIETKFTEKKRSSLEMPAPSQGHYGFHSFPVVD